MNLYIKNPNCKFPKEAEEIEKIMVGFPHCGIRFIMPKKYPHPHTSTNLRILAGMPIEMK